MKLEAVIWDMDGLLLDTERVAHEAWKGATQALQADIDDSVFLEIIGMNHRSFRAKLEELIGHLVDVPRLSDIANDLYHERVSQGVPMKPGARACIEWLSENRVPQSVATSTRQKLATQKLQHHQLVERFHAIVGGDQVERGKPHPEIYLAAAKRMNIEPARCLVFEDSRLGVTGAAAAGAHVILVPDLGIHDDDSRSLAFQIWDSLEKGPSAFEEWFGTD